MSKFVVTIQYSFYDEITVEASNEDEAYALAEEQAADKAAIDLIDFQIMDIEEVSQLPDATPLLVAADQDDESHIVAALCGLNVPAVRSESHLPVDYVWTIDGRPYMGDNKTPSDLIASAEDGRLFQQVWDMQQAGCAEMFILIEGEWSFDNGYNVGNPKHPWSWEEFDALCQSLYERCGVTIVHSARKERTPFRLKALYKRSYEEKGDVASWQLPVKASRQVI